MDSESISTPTWWATKYSFTSLVAENRTDVIRFLRGETNTKPPLLLPIGGDALPPILT